MKQHTTPRENANTINRAELLKFGKNIRQIREHLGLTLDQLAAAAGISKPYLSNIETASAPGLPSPAKLTAIEKSLQLPPGHLMQQADWLRTPPSIRRLLPLADNPGATLAVTSILNQRGDRDLPRRSDGAINLDALLNSPTVGQLETNIATAETGPDIPIKRVPLINRVPAGHPAEFTDLDYPVGIADGDVPAPANIDAGAARTAAAPTGAANDMFALRIQGDSMEPHYHHGDIIVLSATQTPKDGDDCLVRFDERRNFSTTFKRIYFEPSAAQQPPTHLRLEPLNRKHRNRLIDLQHISGIFPAIWKITPAASQLPTSGTPGDAEPSTLEPEQPPAATARRRPRKLTKTAQTRNVAASHDERPEPPLIEPSRSATFPIELD